MSLTRSDEVRDALDVLGRGAARHPEHLVALLEEQLGQVRAVLPRDASDQRLRSAIARHPI